MARAAYARASAVNYLSLVPVYFRSPSSIIVFTCFVLASAVGDYSKYRMEEGNPYI